MSRGGWKDYSGGGRAAAGPSALPTWSLTLGSLSLHKASLASRRAGTFHMAAGFQEGETEAVKGLKAEVRGSHSLTVVHLCWSKQDTRSAQTTEEEIETPAPDEERGQVPTRMGEILVAFLADILCTNKVLVSKISKELLGFIKKETPKKWKQTFTGKKMRMAWKHIKRSLLSLLTEEKD